MATLNLLQSILAFDDPGTSTNSNPSQRICDYSRQFFGISVANAESQKFTVPANSSLTLFDGTRTTTIAGGTVFDLVSPSISTYRLNYVSGTTPGFRTSRTLSTDATTAFNVTINNNALVTLSYASGTAPNFTSVLVGDTLYISNTSPFNVLNTGYFIIVSKTATSISFQNPNAVAESGIALGASFASKFLIYSSDNIQVGDTLVISAGFSPVTQGAYEVTAVAPTFVEFISTTPLPLETGITPGSTGIVFYSQAKFIIYIEANQNCSLRLNAETSNNVNIEPLTFDTASSVGIRGIFSKIGNTYKAILVNRSTVNPATVFIFTAERA